jgi:DNA-binding response OmpR family regulator
MIARFHKYELDLSTSELRLAGTVVPLERQPAIALTLLVTRAGRLVSRVELRRIASRRGCRTAAATSCS